MATELIIALDYDKAEDAIRLVDLLGDKVSWYKVGLELFLNSRGSVVDALKERNKKVFLDLKFHDIGNTCAAACRWAAKLGVDLINVHALGGYDMMKRAQEAVQEAANACKKAVPKLIAVTILTSFDDNALKGIGVAKQIDDEVLSLTKLALTAGLSGVVCSPKEVKMLKTSIEESFITVCPGVRPSWAASNDQSRIMTPRDAKENGVDYIVVGRPITKHEDPKEALLLILEELRDE